MSVGEAALDGTHCGGCNNKFNDNERRYCRSTTGVFYCGRCWRRNKDVLNLPQHTVTNEDGAKQSATAHRMDLLPMLAVLHVAGVLKPGAEKYGEGNWRGIPSKDHLNHALIHLAAFTTGDKSEDHAGHAACRVLMWLESLYAEGKIGNEPQAK